MDANSYYEETASGRPAKLLESIAFVLIFLVAMFAIDWFLHFAGLTMTRRAAIGILVKIAAFAIVSMAIGKRLHGKVAQMVNLGPAPVSIYVFTVIGVLGIALFLTPLDGFFLRTFPFYYRGALRARALYVSDDPVGTMLRSLLVTPVTEETLFRGIIFAGLVRNYRLPTAVAADSLMFAFYHFNPAQFIGPLLGATVFALAYWRSNSLFPCLFGHLVNNTIWFFSLTFHLNPNLGFLFTTFRIAVGIIFLAASVVLLLFRKRPENRLPVSNATTTSSGRRF